jgi:hypothetical protein
LSCRSARCAGAPAAITDYPVINTAGSAQLGHVVNRGLVITVGQGKIGAVEAPFPASTPFVTPQLSLEAEAFDPAGTCVVFGLEKNGAADIETSQ